MNTRGKNFGQRLLALLLCAAMLLPMIPQFVRAQGSNPGVVLSKGIVAGENVSGTVNTGSSKLILKQEKSAFTRNGHYAIVSGDKQYIMQHDSATYSSGGAIESMVFDADGGRADTFSMDASGNIYIDHSDRDSALWVLKQFGISSGTYITQGSIGNASTDYKAVRDYAIARAQALFVETSKVFFGMELQKGIQSAADEGGVKNGPYWYSTAVASANRFLNWMEEASLIQSKTVSSDMTGADGDRLKYSFAMRPEGKFVIYFVALTPGNADGTWGAQEYQHDLRVLYCDKDGCWRVQRYKTYSNGTSPEGALPYAQAKTDIEKGLYDVCLYKYNEDTGNKQVTFNGYQTYNVVTGMKWEELLSEISKNFFIYDPATKLPIPSSDNTPKVGCYYFDIGNRSLDSAVSGEDISVNLYYVDDGYISSSKNKTLITTLTVGAYDADSLALSAEQGITSLNSAFKYQVFKAEKNPLTNKYVATNEPITFTFGNLTAPVTLNMVYTGNAKTGHISTTTADLTVGTAASAWFGDNKLGNLTMYVADGTIHQQLPSYPNAGSVWLGKESTTLQSEFSKDGQAAIELSATGIPTSSPMDLIVMLDLSSSMRYAMTGEDSTDYYRSPYYSPNTNSLNVVGDGYIEEKNKQVDSAWSLTEWQTTRMYAMEQSLKKLVKSLQATGADVNIAMADFGDLNHYLFPNSTLNTGGINMLPPYLDGNADGEFDNNGGYEIANHLNYILGRDDFSMGLQVSQNKKWVSQPFALHDWKYIDFTTPQWKQTDGTTITLNKDFMGLLPSVIYTKHDISSDTVSEHGSITDAFSNVNDLTPNVMNGIIEQLRISNSKMLGTNYDLGLEYAYKLAYQRQQQNLVNGEDRQIVIVFMSDGAAMQYNYFSGRSVTDAWSQYLIGETDMILTNHKDAQSGDYSWDLTDADNDGNLDHYAEFNPLFQQCLELFHKSLADTGNTAYGKLTAPYSTADNPVWCNGCSHYDNPENATGANFFSCIMKQDWFKAEAERNGWVSAWSEENLLLLFNELHYANKVSNNHLKTKLAGELDMGKIFTGAYSWDLTDANNDGSLDNYYRFHPLVQEYLRLFHKSLADTNNTLYGKLTTPDSRKDSVTWCAGCSHYNNPQNATGANFFSCIKKQSWFKANGWNDGTLWLLFTQLVYGNEVSNPYINDKLVGRSDMVRILSMPAGGSYTIKNGDDVEYNTSGIQYQTYSPYYYFYNEEGKNWWAEAIKGAKGTTQPVIDLYAKGTIVIEGVDYADPMTAYNTSDFYRFKDKNTNYSTGTGLALDGKDYISGFPGLGVPIYTVGFCMTDENMISAAEANTVLKNICSDPLHYYFSAADQEALDDALTSVVESSSMSASRAYYIDTMGDAYDLDTATNATITVSEYALQKDSNGNIKLDDNGAPIRTGAANVLETITITGDNAAESTAVTGDVWNEETGLITGQYVVYNTNTSGVSVDFGSASKITLPGESFLWNIGTMPDKLLVLSYEVELTGAMDGEYEVNTERGIYETNESAVLTYYDFMGNLVSRDTVSPQFAYGDYNEIKVVIDYGIPVDIAVLNDGKYTSKYLDANGSITADAAGETFTAKITGVSKIKGMDAEMIAESNFADTTNGDYGKITAFSGDTVTYQPGSMEMNSYEKFSVQIQRTGDSSRYYYCTVYVIPATIMYYEDSGDFIDFNKLTWNQKQDGEIWEGHWTVSEDTGSNKMWNTAGQTADLTQEDDRPGINANGLFNIYGHDVAYKSMAMHSLGSAMKATVNYDNGAQASFKFYGTGFDVVSMTSTDTGTIFVDVYKLDENGNRVGNPVRQNVVDTYYGYVYGLYNVRYEYSYGDWILHVGEPAADGATETPAVKPESPKHGDIVSGIEYCWVAAPNIDKALYQVPVMEVSGLTYGRYEAVISAIYDPLFDHKDSSSGEYDFYLDAIRIYDPANNGEKDSIIEEVYISDHEAWPTYIELRNQLIDKSLDADDNVNGAVFVDGKDSVKDAEITKYINYGPNNEVYLAPGQSVAFMLACSDNVDYVHIGIKSANGTACGYKMTALNTSDGSIVKSSDYTVSTTTDMYYDMSSFKDYIVVVENTGEGIISVTNIKSTYAPIADTLGVGGESYVFMNRRAATMVLDYLNREVDGSETENPGQGSEGNPATGDVSQQHVFVVTAVLLISTMALVVVLVTGRKGSV